MAGKKHPLAKRLFPEDNAIVAVAPATSSKSAKVVKQEAASPQPTSSVAGGTLDYAEARKMLGQLKTRASKGEEDPEQRAAVSALDIYGSMKGSDKVSFIQCYMEARKSGKKLGDWLFSYGQVIETSNLNKIGITEDWFTRPRGFLNTTAGSDFASLIIVRAEYRQETTVPPHYETVCLPCQEAMSLLIEFTLRPCPGDDHASLNIVLPC